jgi:hypothetical protein
VQYLPDWFPGTGFKQTAREWGAELTQVTEKPYAFVKHQLALGQKNESFLAQLLERGDEGHEEKFTNKWSAMSLYTAGADTVIPIPNPLLFERAWSRANDLIDGVVNLVFLPRHDSLPGRAEEGTRRD